MNHLAHRCARLQVALFSATSKVGLALLCAALVGCASDRVQQRQQAVEESQSTRNVWSTDQQSHLANDATEDHGELEEAGTDDRAFTLVHAKHADLAAWQQLHAAWQQSHVSGNYADVKDLQADFLLPVRAVPASDAAPMVERLTAPPPAASVGPRISETFVENDVQEALQILATQAKVEVIIDDMVRGVTSAVINDEPFESALEKVLSPLGYIYRQVGDQYLIGVPDPDSALFSRIADRYDYHTKHLPPSELMELLPEHFKNYIRISEKRNLIIIEAPPQIADEVLADLARSDQPVGQVVLEAVICVLSPEKALQLGVDLDLGIPLSGDSVTNLALTGLNLTSTYGAASALAPGVSNFARTSAYLRALERDGHVSIRAAPHVMAKDGETANISIAKETFFSVQPSVGAAAFFRQEIEKIEAGITLNITPVIRGDHVTMRIERAEVSEGIDSSAFVNAQATNTFPTINRRQVSTTVHVRDQETITIGGLTQRQYVNQLSQIPILGDIPYIGKLFQRIDRREEETEVVIFISPRIIYGSSP